MEDSSRKQSSSKQEVRLKLVDPQAYAARSTISRSASAQNVEVPSFTLPSTLCGVTPSDIDKYSRVVFPVCFVCFNLMYWIIYLHISDVLVDVPEN
ncbi:putative GABA-activated chloride channel, rdl [Caerostris darwini]|uniref:GABA-activated chloride channel, rdl n=1 Tax=Caerostris darwini TaxID=1538125 RepID=A0AAV4VK31_9ARAC|nr:putative GABA-activated chloride channel, rdl [Caerostris darwini]